MASKIKVDQLEGSTGSTITIPTGQTFTVTDGIPVASGGTGLASFTAGDILYATGATTLTKLNKGTAEQVLAMNAGATAPDWGSVDLTVLPTISVAKGGTNLASFTAGDILYATGSTTLAKLAKGTTLQGLRMNAGATAPEWAEAASANYAKQIKYFQTNTTYSMASTTYADTGISLTLDNNLASTDSIIKITISAMTGSNSNPNRIIGEYRDAGGSKITDVIGNPDYHWGNSTSVSSDHWHFMTCVCFANVSSTTPIAYRPYWKRQTGSDNVWLGRSNDNSSTYPTMFMIEEYAE